MKIKEELENSEEQFYFLYVVAYLGLHTALAAFDKYKKE